MQLRVLLLCLVSAAFTFDNVALAMLKQEGSCAWFHSTLDPVPQQTLSLDSGVHESLYDGESFMGCQVGFETNEILLSGRDVPDLTAVEGTDLYRLGWRMDDSIAADGPGTSLFTIRRELCSCVILEDQSAYLDDRGRIVQTGMIKITIQCRQE